MGIEIVIAAIVAYIAWQQHKIERNKLHWMKYDRRLKVFESFMELFAVILQRGQVSDEIWNKYKTGTKEAFFLFDSEISDYKKTVDNKTLELLLAPNTLKDLPVGEERTAKAKEISELRRWFANQSVVTKSKFDKHLKFEQVGQPSRLWLAGIIVFLIIITLQLNCNKTGRYVSLPGSSGGIVILDTKTSQLWGRIEDKIVDMGTIKKPLYEITEIDELKKSNKEK